MISAGIFPTPLGQMAIAASPRGVCLVSISDDVAALREELSSAVPLASLEPDDRLNAWAGEIGRRATGDASALDIPLDTSGTPFQERVWAELHRIPFGETCSYQQLAERIGQPTAVRAVAAACASNRVAILIPCHRVVRTDGALGGYRWGVERKQALLRAEAGAAETLCLLHT